MPKTQSPFNAMSLYNRCGERKYLNSAERERYIAALNIIENPAERTFCELLYWTGCRPSEALGLHAINIDLEENTIIVRSLKKRGDQKGRHFRPIPVPSEFVKRLDDVHNIKSAQARADHGQTSRLWPFGRTKGWRLVKTVMDAAGLTGVKSSARGLRHALGVHAAVNRIPQTRLQSWLGHASLETTSIYIDASGPEDRAIARRMWRAA
ncbi:MAG: site-specific integrase [Cohaesibacter sp.]|nr:site-specific integrase [Cohaesibacter sp.]